MAEPWLGRGEALAGKAGEQATREVGAGAGAGAGGGLGPGLQAVLQVGVANPEAGKSRVEPLVKLVDDHKGDPSAEDDAQAALRVRRALRYARPVLASGAAGLWQPAADLGGRSGGNLGGRSAHGSGGKGCALWSAGAGTGARGQEQESAEHGAGFALERKPEQAQNMGIIKDSKNEARPGCHLCHTRQAQAASAQAGIGKLWWRAGGGAECKRAGDNLQR